ncbi:MAG TPA: cytochrome c maturation protein CcmE [Candidatus Dormibacteraeota bacterium]|nr:cytochrome c maturation protein CcmE [Candidatus Dormibacteraeota bacterium]
MAQPISRKVVITVGLLVLGFAVLFSVGLRGSLVYYLTVSEFMDPARKTDLGDNFRVNGIVQPGSIQRAQGAPGARFILTDGARQLPVVYRKEVPDTFVDGSEAVVEGALGADGTFAAVTLLAKCPSKYEAQNRQTNNYRKPAGQGRPGTPTDAGSSSR